MHTAPKIQLDRRRPLPPDMAEFRQIERIDAGLCRSRHLRLNEAEMRKDGRKSIARLAMRIAVAVVALAVVTHIVRADPLGRLAADLHRIEQMRDAGK